MRRALWMASMMLAAAVASADIVTLPAAASIQGGNPFFSDVRVFNTSYTSSLDVTATYQCFIATVACPSAPPQIHITLAPRASQAFDDMVAATSGFATPDTAGGVEFEFSGSPDQLVVTSRLFSTFPQNSVGMFIPGLDVSDAHSTTVLTSIRHDPGTASGFRTNVGVFNPGDAAANVTFTIFDNGTNQLGSPVTRSVPGHSGVQVSAIFDAAGAGAVSTENAVIVVSASAALFSYAAVLDNRTADPIFVVGAQDQPEQPITPVPTSTTPVATATPTVPGPTVTPTPPSGFAATVDIGANGGLVYIDRASGNKTTTITAGGTVHWVWANATHSTTSDTGVWDSMINTKPHTFDHTFPSAGTFPYHCLVHGVMMNGMVIVNP
jgi:plastocyanin